MVTGGRGRGRGGRGRGGQTAQREGVRAIGAGLVSLRMEFSALKTSFDEMKQADNTRIMEFETAVNTSLEEMKKTLKAEMMLMKLTLKGESGGEDGLEGQIKSMGDRLGGIESRIAFDHDLVTEEIQKLKDLELREAGLADMQELAEGLKQKLSGLNTAYDETICEIKKARPNNHLATATEKRLLERMDEVETKFESARPDNDVATAAEKRLLERMDEVETKLESAQPDITPNGVTGKRLLERMSEVEIDTANALLEYNRKTQGIYDGYEERISKVEKEAKESNEVSDLAGRQDRLETNVAKSMEDTKENFEKTHLSIGELEARLNIKYTALSNQLKKIEYGESVGGEENENERMMVEPVEKDPPILPTVAEPTFTEPTFTEPTFTEPTFTEQTHMTPPLTGAGSTLLQTESSALRTRVTALEISFLTLDKFRRGMIKKVSNLSQKWDKRWYSGAALAKFPGLVVPSTASGPAAAPPAPSGESDTAVPVEAERTALLSPDIEVRLTSLEQHLREVDSRSITAAGKMERFVKDPQSTLLTPSPAFSVGDLRKLIRCLENEVCMNCITYSLQGTNPIGDGALTPKQPEAAVELTNMDSDNTNGVVHANAEVLAELRKGIEENRREVCGLSWRIHFLDDLQNRFAILRNYLRGATKTKIKSGRPRFSKMGLVPTAEFLAFTAKCPTANCSYETCMTLFRALHSTNKDYSIVHPDASALKEGEVHLSRVIYLTLPTFADVCCFLHIPPEERLDLAVRLQNNKGFEQGTTNIVAGQFERIDENGTVSKHLCIGRGNTRGLPQDAAVDTLLQYTEGTEGTTEDSRNMRLRPDTIPSGNKAFESETKNPFKLVWTRTMPFHASKTWFPTGVHGTLHIEVPMVCIRSFTAHNDLKQAVGGNPSLISSLFGSPFEAVLPFRRVMDKSPPPFSTLE